jgi:succinate dehydrogenase subunit C
MPQYSQFQPKPYRPRMSAYWYLDQWDYLLYALREASSFFVAYFAIIILLQVAALGAGPAAYAKFEALLANPIMIIVNAVAFLFVMFHMVTWFNLVPRVMMRQILGKPTPDAVSAAPNFAIWFGASIIVAIFILRII